MRFLVSTAVVLLLGSTLTAQSLDCNRICLHNGAEYFVTGIDRSSPNAGCGKYYPSFVHWAGEGVGTPLTWPWKIRGWCWTGMMANHFGPTWTWTSALMRVEDNAYSMNMTWDFPINYVLGIEPCSGPPWVVYGSGSLPVPMPTVVPRLVFPSSYGGFDAYLNIFAHVINEPWFLPSTAPYYAWEFALVVPASSPVYLASGNAIYTYVWENRGAFGQYCILSGNERDCTLLGGGNKGRGYSIGSEEPPGFYYFNNTGNGCDSEWAFALFVEDAVTIPVNYPAVASSSNPFAAYGFDVGVSTVTPLFTSGQASLMFMTEDHANPGTSRVILSACPWSGPCVPFGQAGYRLPHAWDPFSDYFASIAIVWLHQTSPGYPACMYGTTVGGHSIAVHVPLSPVITQPEMKFSAFSTSGKAPTASFLLTPF